MELAPESAPVIARPLARVKGAALKSGALRPLIVAMRDAMLKHNGIGLAANQVGEDLALFVIDEKLAAEYGVPSVFANPEITEYGRDADEMEEGCLTIPGFWVPVRRAKKIMFKALDGDGNRVKFRARGMLARVLQHETDHTNGTTIRARSRAHVQE